MLGWMERILELLAPILDRWPQGVDDLTDAAALAALVALVFSARRVRGVAPVWSAARALANLLLGFLSVLVLFRLALELPPIRPGSSPRWPPWRFCCFCGTSSSLRPEPFAPSLAGTRGWGGYPRAFGPGFAFSCRLGATRSRAGGGGSSGFWA